MKTKAPSLYTLKNLLRTVDPNDSCQVEVGGRWVPARPLGDDSLLNRVKCAWLAFTGRADVVVWPEDDNE